MANNHGGARAYSGRPSICDALKNRSVGFSLAPVIDDWLKARAKRLGQSKSRVLSEILDKAMENPS